MRELLIDFLCSLGFFYAAYQWHQSEKPPSVEEVRALPSSRRAMFLFSYYGLTAAGIIFGVAILIRGVREYLSASGRI